MTTPTDKKLITIREVEKMLGVNHAFLYNTILASGELPTLKIGKRRFVRPEALDAYIAKLEEQQNGI